MHSNYGLKLNLMQSEINTCIIPAAGRGSRWAPISGYLPKEMLPLINKPVIEWVIDEAVSSKCKKIVIVINKRKQIIKEHIIKNYKNKKIKLVFINQEKPLGVAHAIYLCKKETNNLPFIVALPDLPTISKIPTIKQLIKLQNDSHVISFDTFPPKDRHLYGQCLLRREQGKILKVLHFCSKNHDHSEKLRMSGRFIFQPNIFPIIEKSLKKQKKEITDQDILKTALKNHKITGVEIQGRSYDTGTPISYVRANTAFFKKYIS